MKSKSEADAWDEANPARSSLALLYQQLAMVIELTVRTAAVVFHVIDPGQATSWKAKLPRLDLLIVAPRMASSRQIVLCNGSQATPQRSVSDRCGLQSRGVAPRGAGTLELK